jgi:general secretion pathway protein L
MDILPPIQEGFNRWIDSVAGSVNGLLHRLHPNHDVRIVEEAPDTFTLQVADAGKNSNGKTSNGKTPNGKKPGKKSHLADQQIRIANGALERPLPVEWARMLRGSRAELVLRPSRFLFRPLDLPKRAVEFLEGVVRSQIDRLTPWTSGEAVFSWTPPVDGPNDRIELTIAATAQALIAPYVQAIADLGVASVAVLTVPAPEAAPIKVYEQRARGVLEIDRIRQGLIALLLISGLAAAGTMTYSVFALDSLDAEQQTLTQKINARRAALRTGPAFTQSAQRLLERRKQTTPSNVIVLEALSQILPDHTYVTELHIEGDKLQIVGVTRDAAALIGLIEQSPHFIRAAFYAPTTRTPGDPGERYHIEARIKPVFAVGT